MQKGDNQLPLDKVNEPSTGKDSKKEDRYLFESWGSQILSYQQDVAERKKFAKWIFYLVGFWLLSVLVIIILASIKYGFDDKGTPLFIFETSDTVLISLVGTTTINVLGLFVIVANYLFSERTPPKIKEKGLE